MKYKKLGNTNIDVSLICLGSMTWGEQNTPAQAFEQMDYAVEQGVNFFDAAEMYPVAPREETFGRTEEIIGDWIKESGKRKEIILASKVTGRHTRNNDISYIRNGCRLDKKNINEAIEGSLKRLKTDYIDLYQVHWPERSTNFFGRLGYEHSDDDGIPIEETYDAMNDLVKQGKVRHIGISNESPWGMMRYQQLSNEKGYSPIESIQNPYNLLNRVYEVGGAEISIRENISCLAYSPLAFGALSGKYLNDARPEGARLTLFERFKRYTSPQCEEATAAYVKLAQDSGITPAELALAFVNSRDFITSNIIGATTVEQLKENIGSVDIELSDDIISAINKIHHTNTNPAP